MDRKCKNCRFFKQGGVMVVGDVWGDCLKPRKYSLNTKGKEAPGVFVWADESCSYFEPRRKLVNLPNQNS